MLKIIKNVFRTFTPKSEVKASDVSGLASPYEYMDLEDITANDIAVTPSGNLSSTTVQAALTELQTSIDAVSGESLSTTKSANFTINNVKMTSIGGVNAWKYGDIVHMYGQINFNTNATSADFTVSDVTIPTEYAPVAVLNFPIVCIAVEGVKMLIMTINGENIGFISAAGLGNYSFTPSIGTLFINATYNINVENL